jgi:hypothetical protein
MIDGSSEQGRGKVEARRLPNLRIGGQNCFLDPLDRQPHLN